MTPFSLTLPPRLRFGRGEALAAVPDILSLGTRFVFVTGRSQTRAGPLMEALKAQGATLHHETCTGEPDLDMLVAALARARDMQPDAVIAMGGGAAVDLGKALAALIPAPDPDPLEHLEVVGKGLPLTAAPLPCVALPTTSGTGSEATKNAVISVPAEGRKVSLRDAAMVPSLAIIDPSLTDGTPRAVTMASGMDAVTQVIEPYLSARANPVTDALCRDAIPRGFAALATLATAEDPDARDTLALVAHLSGIALANAGLGAVHGIAGVLGGQTGAPHGAICGQLLAPILRAVRAAAQPDSTTARRIAEIDGWCLAALGCDIDGLGTWARDYGLPEPEVPLSPALLLEIAESSAASSSMKSSPVALPAATLVDALREAGWG